MTAVRDVSNVDHRHLLTPWRLLLVDDAGAVFADVPLDEDTADWYAKARHRIGSSTPTGLGRVSVALGDGVKAARKGKAIRPPEGPGA